MTTITGVPDEVAEALVGASRERGLRRGETVFVQGDAGDAAYVVVSGKVVVEQKASSGADTVLALLGPGQVFGELSVLDGAERSASARAIEPSVVRELTQEALQRVLEERPELVGWLLRYVAARLRRANDTVSDLVFSDVPARVAGALLGLAEQFGEAVHDGLRVEHGMTQLELAQLAGAARETVNKALADFNRRGWITSKSRWLVIHDADALRRRAG